MSFSRLPNQMVGYATYELSEKLARLSTDQRAAISRIVQHVYVDNRPLADLFRGERPICSETNYYRRGTLDEATGQWSKRPGWGHDKAFSDALGEAVRLALQAKQREEVKALEDAVRRSKLASSAIIDEMVSLATRVQVFEGVQRERDVADKDQIQAAKVVLDFAIKVPAQTMPTSPADSEEFDWWKAAEDEST
jgi:hypothetical protein